MEIWKGVPNWPGLETFENGWGDWYTDRGVWQVTTRAAREGTNCAGTAASGNYPSQSDSRLISPLARLPSVDSNDHLKLRFWQAYSYSGQDNAYVEVSEWSGTSWGDWARQGQVAWESTSRGWARGSLDLTAYAGRQIRVGFLHTAQNDGWSGQGESTGWVIDDVEIKSGPDMFNNPESFEAGWGDWDTDNYALWQIGDPTFGPPLVNGSRAYSPTSVAATVLSGNYSANSTGRLMSPRFIVPAMAGDERTMLRFWQWYAYGTGDSGTVQIQSEYDSAWTTLQTAAPSGSSGGWQQVNIDLTPYQGQQVRLGFLQTANSDGSVGAGWYLDDLSLSSFVPTPLAPDAMSTNQFTANGQSQYYVIHVPPGGHLRVNLDDLDNLGINEVYIRRGSLPTPGSYDYKFKVSGADQTIFVPNAGAGDWFILAYNDSGLLPGDYEMKVEFVEGVILDSVSPALLSNAGLGIFTIDGAGFTPSDTVALVGSGTYAASSVSYQSAARLVANFDLTAVPAGSYQLQVTSGSHVVSLPVTITPRIGWNLETDLIVPSSLGYHGIGTIYVEYKNTGDTAIKAPLLYVTAYQNGNARALLTLDSKRLVAGFWTSAIPEGFSNGVQFLASGATPGLLQPGETGRVPIYYAGWQQPWDFGYPPIQWSVGVLRAESSLETENIAYDAPVGWSPPPGWTPPPDSRIHSADWSSVKAGMKPDYVRADAWDALWNNFTNRVGGTWNSYLDRLDDNAIYLNSIGSGSSDITRLLSFTLRQCDAFNPIRTLAQGTDAAMVAPGLGLVFSRAYAQPISRRYEMGPLGRGWAHGWQWTLRKESDGTVRITGMTGTPQIFQPDSRSTGKYFSSPGDQDRLTDLAGGAFRLTKPDGSIYVFRSDGHLDYIEDTNANRITCGYSGGLLTSLTHSSGASLAIAYNGAGRISSVTDSDGRQTLYTYTGEHLTAVQAYDGRTTRYTYITGQGAACEHALSQVEFADGSHRYFTYDPLGRLATTAADGNVGLVTFSYDDTGTVTATDALGHSSQFFFDDWGQILKAINPLGNSVLLALDDERNVKSVTDPAGRSFGYEYDSRGNLARFTDPNGGVTRLGYTTDLNRLAVLTDAKGNLTRYAYDTKGNLASITYANSSVESWTYETNGLPNQWTNRRGKAIGVTWDAAGRPTSKTYDDGATVNYLYDAKGNLTQTTDATGTNTYSYNTQEYLTRIDYPGGQWLEFGYDTGGRRASSLNQLGHRLDYQYDAAGRLAQISDESGSNVVSYAYDAASRLAQKDLGNGVYTTYEYDAAGQLLRLANHQPGGAVLSFFDYTYDSRGRRTSMAIMDGTWTYTYDDLGQLTRAVFASSNTAEVPDQDLVYVYDALGNRIQTIENGTTTVYTANNLNQYTTAGGTTCTFDADGNLTQEVSGGVTTIYSYDDENRLIAVTKGTDIWAYTYDALGQRVASAKNGTATRYVIDPAGLGNVVGEYDDAGNLTASYDHGFGMVSRTASGATAFYTSDALGSTAEITDASGNILNGYIYAPFGGVLNQSGSLPNPFQFVGAAGVMAESHGLSFMRARFYDAAKGRFTQADPIGMAGGLNNYTYVENNPTYRKDPRGLCGNGNPIAEILSEAGANIAILLGFGAAHAVTGGTVDESLVNVAPSKSSKWAVERGFPLFRALESFNDATEIGNEYTGAVSKVMGLGVPMLRNAPWYSSGNISTPGGVVGGYCAPSQHSVMPVIPWVDWLKDLWNKIVHMFDPNELLGPAGYGTAHYIAADSVLPYRIGFENYSGATAPAQIVTVTDPLNSNLDWSTFELTEIAFGDQYISIPKGTTHFAKTVSMTYGGATFEVQIEAGIKLATGEVYAKFYSIDPLTGLPPPVDIGFLPPEDGTGRGMGHVSYVLRPKAGLPTGTEIRNIASIVFDSQPAIDTNQIDPHDASKGTDPNKEALVTIDATPPSSAVIGPIGSVPATFTVSWGGTDVGAGIAGYDIYLSTNSGPWTLWLDNTETNAAQFVGQKDDTYSFYSVARDGVGHEETGSATADVTVMVNQTSHALTATSTRGGQVAPSGTIYVASGTHHTFNFIPDTWWHVKEVLVNGLPKGAVSSYTFFDVQADGLVHVEFAQNMVTNAPVPVPEEWLAQQGWTSNLSDAVLADPDGDGLATWQEYVAGTSPINPASCFRITEFRLLENGEFLISWEPSFSNRQYHVVLADSPNGPYAESLATITGPANSATVPANHARGMLRVAVEMHEAPPQWLVMAFAEKHGSITPAGLHYVSSGSNTLSFTIKPEPWYHVADVKTNGVSAGAVESLVLSNITENIGIQAEFALNMVTNAPVAIPEQWLAEQGWTNNFQAAVTNDPDGDGFATWKEYLADSDPTNAASFLHITQIRQMDGDLLISWTPSSANRRYRLMQSSSLNNPFTELMATQVGPANSVIVPADRSSGFLRLEVELFESPPKWVVISSAIGNGAIQPSGLQYVTYGSNSLSFAIDPSPWHHIENVITNGVSAGPVTSLDLSGITENLLVVATFAQNVVTTAPVDVPEYWLAQQGLTNHFEAAVTSDADGDGFLTWQEYVAGTEPTNPSSLFRITQHTVEDEKWIIKWDPSVVGRLYTPVLIDLSTGTRTELPSMLGPINTITTELGTTGILRMEVEINQ